MDIYCFPFNTISIRSTQRNRNNSINTIWSLKFCYRVVVKDLSMWCVSTNQVLYNRIRNLFIYVYWKTIQINLLLKFQWKIFYRNRYRLFQAIDSKLKYSYKFSMNVFDQVNEIEWHYNIWNNWIASEWTFVQFTIYEFFVYVKTLEMRNIMAG